MLAVDTKANRERDTYLPARLETNEFGHLIAVPLKWQGSSDFIGYGGADSLIVIPKGEFRKKNDVVDIVYL